MALRGAEEEEKGRAALRSLGPAMEQKSLLAPVSLELQGLSHFRHQAVPLSRSVAFTMLAAIHVLIMMC